MKLLQALKVLYLSQDGDKELLEAYTRFFYPVMPFVFRDGKFHRPSPTKIKSWILVYMVLGFQAMRYLVVMRGLILKSELDMTLMMIYWLTMDGTGTVFLLNATLTANQQCRALNTWLKLKNGMKGISSSGKGQITVSLLIDFKAI